jgi:hypothetical protein
MNRRRLLTALSAGAACLAGCLSSDQDGAEPPAEPPDDAATADCPETNAEPPTGLSTADVESFIKEFEADVIAASAPTNATRSGSVAVEATAAADGVARADAAVAFGGSGWDGEMTIRPLEEDEPNTKDDGKTDGNADGDVGEGGDEDEPKRVSASASPISEHESLLETIDAVVETGESRTIDDADSLQALSAAGEHSETFLLEHDEHVLSVENDAGVWESHGEWFVGYLLENGAVYRTEHAPDDWRDRPLEDPLDISDNEWERLECWP